ncbi:hypothetical protein SADUNF_Sadunf09G0056000 [Salix dunnii]|uniref:AIR12 DOMON domain-containing protein n=1 Tax=Salix dunnii TaxID=1413687 RepID=A0A835MW49_9ROSI|nr:hypothetical protein SADUNF_Sadunf09G0056000 [Salix dunnii]
MTTLGVEFWMESKADTMWLAWGLNPEDRPQMVGTRTVIGIIQLKWLIQCSHLQEQEQVLPSMYNISRLNRVCQVGYEVQGTEPKMHPTALQNDDSTETKDLKNGWAQHVGEQELYLRMVHIILNPRKPGTFLSAGVVIERYFKYPLSFEIHRYYDLHIGCQIIGYILGTAGWIAGLWLGVASRHD